MIGSNRNQPLKYPSKTAKIFSERGPEIHIDIHAAPECVYIY